ncbi:hypothetical protein ACGC1H_006443 [Rhizoctonia solani]|uniref:Uncharacterized protein n=1 Tax=Rhizoctonia solani TaxID=456999 RepID=A0A8H3A741_9AGAM|nr:unnamed protein product [Rhizoctonia solani]
MEFQSQSSPPHHTATIEIVGNQLVSVDVNLRNGVKSFSTTAQASGSSMSFSGQLFVKSPEDLSGTKTFRMVTNGKRISITIGITDPRSANFLSEELNPNLGIKPQGAGTGTWE